MKKLYLTDLQHNLLLDVITTVASLDLDNNYEGTEYDGQFNTLWDAVIAAN